MECITMDATTRRWRKCLPAKVVHASFEMQEESCIAIKWRKLVVYHLCLETQKVDCNEIAKIR